MTDPYHQYRTSRLGGLILQLWHCLTHLHMAGTVYRAVATVGIAWKDKVFFVTVWNQSEKRFCATCRKHFYPFKD